MTTDLPVWVWRRRARFLAKWLALVATGLALVAAVIAGLTVSTDMAFGALLVFIFWGSAPAIGVLVVEKVARELFVRREIIKQKIKEGAIATGEGAIAKGEASARSARAAKSWVADGFKEEEAKRPSEEQE